MPPRKPNLDGTQVENFDRLRADYAGAKETRFTRTRERTGGIGRPGDWHIRYQTAYMTMIERARSLDRDDVATGQIIDRAVAHTMQGGFQPDPDTGDRAVDHEWKWRWQEWAEDADACDLAGEMEFAEMEYKVPRAMIVDGDHFVLPFVDGQLELAEGHRCQSSKGTRRAINGIVLDDNRKRLEYWFTKNDVDPLRSFAPNLADIRRYPARDEAGNRNVFHVYNPKRVSITRGITALNPIFDLAGMFEDTMFAGVLKQQIAACFVIFRKRSKDWGGNRQQPSPTGAQRNETQSDGRTVRNIQEIAPGMEVVGDKGEELSGFNPPAIGGEFLPQLEMVLTMLGINLGLPLVMTLMDAGESSFSGWRGAIDQARMGFKQNQKAIARKFHKPVWQFKVRSWLASEPTLQKRWEAELNKPLRERKFTPFANTWRLPAWEYIEPYKDAMGDAVKHEKGLTSMRRIHAGRGMDIDDIWRERIHDTMSLFFKAKKAADRFNKKFPDEKLSMWQVLEGPFGKKLGDLALQTLEQEEPERPAGKQPTGDN